jgi:hypothetical protein
MDTNINWVLACYGEILSSKTDLVSPSLSKIYGWSPFQKSTSDPGDHFELTAWVSVTNSNP